MSFNALQKAKIELDYASGKPFCYNYKLTDRDKSFYLNLYRNIGKSFMYDRLKVRIMILGPIIRFNYGTYAVDVKIKSLSVNKVLLHRLTLTDYLDGLMWLDRDGLSFYFEECLGDACEDFYYF